MKQEKNMEPERILVRPRRVAELLDVSVSQAYKLISSGTLPSIRLAGSVRVPLIELNTYLASLGKAEPVRPPATSLR